MNLELLVIYHFLTIICCRWLYRQGTNEPKKFNKYASEAIMAFMWYWIMFHLYYDGEHFFVSFFQCSICRGELGGLTPLWCLSTPKFSLTPTGLVKNTLKIHCWPPLVLPQIEYLFSLYPIININGSLYRKYAPNDLLIHVRFLLILFK